MIDKAPQNTGSRMGTTVRVILQIDVVNYSSLIAEDDRQTFEQVQQELSRIRDFIETSSGTVHSSAGDCFLATFAGAQSALKMALAVQERNHIRTKLNTLTYRIGINIGEVFLLASTVGGNAVNVTARLETLASPGGICISRNLWEIAPPKLRARFERGGLQRLKNISDPIEVMHFGTTGERLAPPDPSASPSLVGRSAMDIVRHQPSVLVRPLKILSDEPNDQFLAEGFTADLIAKLSRFRHLDVIGRASSATLGIELPDANAGRAVSVRYIVSGQYWRGGGRLGIRISLLDVRRNLVIWSDLFERSLEDFFFVASEVAQEATAVMAVQIENIEERLARARDPSDMDAYTLVIRGRLEDLEDGAFGRMATERALTYFIAASEQDTQNAAAFAGMARATSVQWRFGWCEDRLETIDRATKFAMQAIMTDDNNAVSHAELGFVALYRREHDRSLAAYQRALQLNPSDVEIIAFYADALKHAGDPKASLVYFERALRLNPLHPDVYLGNAAHAHFLLRDYDKAIATIRRMRQPLTAQRVLTASLMLAGRETEGHQEAERLRALVPNFRAVDWCRIVPDRLAEHSDLLREGLERAGF